jgi:hypothetical protein
MLTITPWEEDGQDGPSTVLLFDNLAPGKGRNEARQLNVTPQFSAQELLHLP